MLRGLMLLLSGLGAGTACAAENVMLVLDSSGSMWGQIQGRAKVEIARESIGALVAGWPGDSGLGLVAYGHRRKGDCADIETLLPAGPLDARAYVAKVGALKPLGMTPLSAAVVEAAEALDYREKKATVILVSDGEETCGLDPCAVGRDLAAQGKDIDVHVIGFDVLVAAHQAQLRCLAENTGGRYFTARDAGELRGALGVLAEASTQPPLPPASASLQADDEVALASSFAVGWEGPGDGSDYIAIARSGAKDGDFVGYAVVRSDGTAVTLGAPAEAGDYELRYVSPRRTPAVLARRPIRVAEASAQIEAPDSAVAATRIDVVARGPAGARHWIGFAPKGSPVRSYLDYAAPQGSESRLSLRVPAEPGEYELRYVLNGYERILVSRPITVTAATASVAGPDQAMAGDTVTITAEGPVGSYHWIGFAPKGAPPHAYLSYGRPQGPRSELRLMAPVEPGEYELRYVLNEREAVIASRAIVVTPPQGHVSAPAEVRAGAAVVVEASGPVAGGHWIGFAPVGSGPEAYTGGYQAPTQRQGGVSIRAPAQPGDYEVRYVLSGRGKVVIARQPIRVLPAE